MGKREVLSPRKVPQEVPTVVFSSFSEIPHELWFFEIESTKAATMTMRWVISMNLRSRDGPISLSSRLGDGDPTAGHVSALLEGMLKVPARMNQRIEARASSESPRKESLLIAAWLRGSGFQAEVS